MTLRKRLSVLNSRALRKPSLDVEEVEDAIVKSDLTDMTDIMMELIKERDEK